MCILADIHKIQVPVVREATEPLHQRLYNQYSDNFLLVYTGLHHE